MANGGGGDELVRDGGLATALALSWRWRWAGYGIGVELATSGTPSVSLARQLCLALVPRFYGSLLTIAAIIAVIVTILRCLYSIAAGFAVISIFLTASRSGKCK